MTVVQRSAFSINVSVAQMDTFSLADAVTLYSQETSNITTLWAFYTAAAFAAAGFATSGKSKVLTGIVVTIGFWLFTLGHLALLRTAISTQIKLFADIQVDLKAHGGAFQSALAALVVTNNSLNISTLAHLGVDFCATGAMWARILIGRTSHSATVARR